jgi:hypothetical protein
MHQKDHFIVMSSQTLLHVSAYRHRQGAHMILTSYLYVGVLVSIRVYTKVFGPITKIERNILTIHKMSSGF